MDTTTQQKLEDITRDMLEAFEIFAPPVPVETMLQKPREGFWEHVDITKLSGSFMSIKHRYSPRMSMARLLARHIVGSDWGKERGLLTLIQEEDDAGEFIKTFARIIIMPADMVMRVRRGSRTPAVLSMQFEVPEEDAEQRLLELI